MNDSTSLRKRDYGLALVGTPLVWGAVAATGVFQNTSSSFGWPLAWTMAFVVPVGLSFAATARRSVPLTQRIKLAVIVLALFATLIGIGVAIIIALLSGVHDSS